MCSRNELHIYTYSGIPSSTVATSCVQAVSVDLLVCPKDDADPIMRLTSLLYSTFAFPCS